MTHFTCCFLCFCWEGSAVLVSFCSLKIHPSIYKAARVYYVSSTRLDNTGNLMMNIKSTTSSNFYSHKEKNNTYTNVISQSNQHCGKYRTEQQPGCGDSFSETTYQEMLTVGVGACKMQRRVSPERISLQNQ